jgi:hypothetical protein
MILLKPKHQASWNLQKYDLCMHSAIVKESAFRFNNTYQNIYFLWIEQKPRFGLVLIEYVKLQFTIHGDYRIIYR